MYLKKATHYGCLMLLALSISFISCKKDKFDDQPNEVTEPTSTNPGNSTKEIYNSDLAQDSTIIGIKEVRNVIDAKEVIRNVIRETLTQLYLNSHFNPLMPPIVTREPCNCNMIATDCGCPAQIHTSDVNSTPITYPDTLILKYLDKTTCSTCTLSPSGLEVSGELKIIFDADLSTAHSIKIFPQANFKVDTFEITGDSIFIETVAGSTTEYSIEKVSNISVKNTNTNDITIAKNIAPKISTITITDVNSNHGDPTALGFGFMDDMLELHIEQLIIECSNGEEVLASTIEEDNLIYDMNCKMIQDGSIVLQQLVPRPFPLPPSTVNVATYDYGATDPNVTPQLPEGSCDGYVGVSTSSN